MRVSDMEPTSRLVISESDEADTDLVSYIFSENNAFKSQSLTTERVDVEKRTHNSPRWSSRPLIAYLRDVFLPSGYPQSVSDDYLPYQVFDSLQAFCSSIAGLLSSRAVLQGVGVGNADASPTSALLLHILQDTSGRVATILFAHRVGTALEPECKTYRLAADVFNDLAMILDCLSPMVPAGVMRVSILSAAGVLRALCGVAGGSSKASLSAHFAKWGNLAELNAKDSSQETVISLIGMLVGSVVVSHVTGFTTTWIALLGLLALHLSMNYAAVRSVQMTSLNRQRSNIIFSALFESDPNLSQSLDKRRSLGSDSDKTTIQRNSESTSTSPRPSQLSPPLPLPHKILTPAQVASQERIFPRANALTWTSSLPTGNQVAKLGSAEIGISLAAVLKHANGYVPATPISPSININQKASTAFYSAIPMTPFCNLFADEKYILFLYPGSRWYRDSSPKWHASILLKKDCAVTDQLKGWAHALLAARVLYMGFDPDASSLVKEVSNQTGSLSGVEISEKILRCVADTLKVLNEGDRFEGYLAALRASGWELDVGALEIKGGNRLILD